MIMKSWYAVAGWWSFPMLQKSYRQLLHRKDRERSMKTDVKMCDHWYIQTLRIIGMLYLKKQKKRGTPNLELELQY